MSNHYETLGVSQNASDDEIKKAYRKLARQLHPDVNPGKEAEFKKVTHAYDVLSDPSKRRNYDMGGGENGQGPAGGFGGGFGGFGDIFDTFFGGGQGSASGPAPRRQRGSDALISVTIPLRTAVFGGSETFTVATAVLCDVCQGDLVEAGTSLETCTLCHGSGSVQRIARTLLGQVVTNATCNNCHGYGTVIPHPCRECHGEGRVRKNRELTIRIPAGIDSGNRIQLAAQGEVGPAGGPPGDIYVEVEVEPDEVFVRKGQDLTCRLEVPMTAAALGASVPVETFDGARDITIEAGTQSGEVVTLPGLGVGRLRTDGRGDLKVTINVSTPGKLDPEQRDLLAKLAELRGETVPTATLAGAEKSRFSRFKERFSGR